MSGYRLVLPDSLLPVQAYLNVWPDALFLPMLEHMSEGIESTYNDVGWSWSGGEDDDPPPRGKVLFFCGDEKVVIAISEAMAYLEKAVLSHTIKYPKDAEKARAVIEAIRAKLCAVI